MHSCYRLKIPEVEPGLRRVVKAPLETYRRENIRKLLMIAHYNRVNRHILTQIDYQSVIFIPCALWQYQIFLLIAAEYCFRILNSIRFPLNRGTAILRSEVFSVAFLSCFQLRITFPLVLNVPL
jgi:hypothetical protein